MTPYRFAAIACAALLLIAAGAAAAQPPVPPSVARQQANQARPVDEHQCLRVTGSRLPLRPDEACQPVHGQVLTREDIKLDGAVNIGDAIRRAVPSATVSP